VDLSTVPKQEWAAIAALGCDAVWFMGVWERSPAGISISMQNKGLLEDFRRALPDFAAEDNVGSPYCVRRYVADEHLGGLPGLVTARANLRERGLRLILDRVLISAATRNSMTGRDRGTPRACVCTSWQILLTSKAWSGSS
jgi:glycosidase